MFSLILFNSSNFVVDHTIAARAKLGQHAQSMEGVLETIMDTMGFSDTKTTLSIITMLIGDQATLKKLKQDLAKEKKLTTELKDSVVKLEESKTRLLKHNNDLELSFIDKEFDLNKKISTLKADREEERKHIEEQRPQVAIAINKLNHLLLICDQHSKVCPSFTPQQDEYCDKYKATKDDNIVNF